jgi:hypothetical protein
MEGLLGIFISENVVSVMFYFDVANNCSLLQMRRGDRVLGERGRYLRFW